MKKVSKIAYCLILITFLLLTPLKLFTVKINQPSDPTVAIATTSKIMLSNYVENNEEDILIREFCEANSFNPIRIDDNLGVRYEFLIRLWWILLVVNSVVLIVNINNRLEKRKGQLKLA